MSHGGGDSGGDRWLVSYSDFITLLMVMFVVLYSLGQVDVNKYKQLAESMRAAFSGGGAPEKVVDAQINQSTAGKTTDGSPNPIVIPGIPEKPTASEEVAGNLSSMLAKSNLGSEVSVQTNIEGVLISLSEKLLFDPGTANLQAAAYPVLDTIIEMLANTTNQIKIVGHTDTTPPVDNRYANNWELSTARAQVIADYMLAKGIKPERLIVTGRGEYEPIFPNDTTEHKALNSRADIIVVYNVEKNVIKSSSSVLSNP
jgi:chemotaxis protein MotB